MGKGGARFARWRRQLQWLTQALLPVQQPLGHPCHEAIGCGGGVLQSPGLPLGGWQTPQLIKIEDQCLAGLIEQLPQPCQGVLPGEGTEFHQGALALLTQAQQAGAQVFHLPPQPLAPLLLGLHGVGMATGNGLQGVAQIHQQLQQTLPLLDPGP